MGAVICIAIVAFLFLVMSVALFFGKGSWLIAGFNTASTEEKTAFDKKSFAGLPEFYASLFFCCFVRWHF